MDDYILLFLLILVICIFLYVYNNQYLYNMNDCIINNYKKNNYKKHIYKKNKKTNKNLDDYTNLTYIDKFNDTINDTITDINAIKNNTEITLEINDTNVNDTNKIFFLMNNDSTYNIKIRFSNFISKDLLEKMKIKIDGEKKSDFRQFNVESDTESKLIERNLTLTPATNYNLNLLHINENIKSFQFQTGHKLFNNNLLLKLNSKETTDYFDKYKDFSSKKNNNNITLEYSPNNIYYKNDDIIYDSKKQCQYNLNNIFKGIGHNNKKYINLEEIDMKPFNMVNFLIELPDIPNDLKNFIPHRFEIDKLYILNNDDLCPIVFNDNKYTKPKIEPMNIVQGLKKYLLTIKYVEDKYYGKKVKYLVKIKLIYQNLNESIIVERETSPLVFCFTISSQSSIKNNLINKNLKFTENLEYQTKLKNKFIKKQKEQDEALMINQQQLDSILNNIKYQYEKNIH